MSKLPSNSTRPMLDKQEQYYRSIKKHLYFEGQLSSIELSQRINKSLPLTRKILTELVQLNEVMEIGLADSTGGRRPQMYSLRKNLMYIVAVAVDQLVTRIELIDMEGSAACPEYRFSMVLKNNPDALSELATQINHYVDQAGIDRRKIAGVGIAMPGFVDVIKGINHSFFKVVGQSIVEYVEMITGLPVLIDNDSSTVALAELRHGMAKGCQNVMVVNISWGVGLGMILKGELFRGNSGFAGEFSHIPMFKNNKICSCGKMGCLETETSLLFIIERALEGISGGVATNLNGISLETPEESFRKILESAQNGDKFSIELIAKAGYNIGVGISILTHLLNPELVILSGRGSLGGKLWIAPIQQALNEHCIPKIAENLELKVSKLGYDAEIIGAAAMIMEHYDENALIAYSSA